MLVSEITTTDVVTVDATQSLRDAIAAMRDGGTTYCVVESDGIPSGLITQQDALEVCFRTGRPLQSIPLDPFVRGFATTVEPHKTVYYAVGKMISADVDVLPIKDGLDIVAVLTQADVMANLTNLTRETVDNLRRGSSWK